MTSVLWTGLGGLLLAAPGLAAQGSAPAPPDSCPPVPVATSGDARTAERLCDLSQRLLDAIAPGDTAVWSRHLDNDGVFVDEEANVRDKRAMLAQIRPLPAGIGGRICVTAPRATFAGGVAVLTYDAMETAIVYGQLLKTRYHTTDTYIRRGAEWKLLGQHIAVLPGDHAPVPVRAEFLDDYVGDYVLAPGVEYRVEREGDRLFGTRMGRSREELFPLGPDRFFRQGARRGERIFRRGPDGRVDAMLDRRDNNDLVWSRRAPQSPPGVRPLTYQEFRAPALRAALAPR